MLRTRLSVCCIFLFTVFFANASAEILIVLNKAEGTASLIDLENGKVWKTIETGEGPHEVAVSPDGKRAIIANYGSQSSPGSTLTLVDIVNGAQINTIDLGAYKRPHGLAWLRDNKICVVTVEANRALLLVHTENGEVIEAIPTDQEVSHMVAVAPAGKWAYVANIASGSVTVIDLRKRIKMLDVITGAGSEGIDVTPDGKEIWVTNREADTISVIDASTFRVISTLESRSFPIRIKITPDGRFALVSNAKSGDIAVFDAARKREIRRIIIPLQSSNTEERLFGNQFGQSSVPIGILIHPDASRAFVAHANADTISIIDLKKWTFAGSLTAGKEPDGLGYSAQKPNQ